MMRSFWYGLATLKSAGGDSLVMAQGARFAVGMAALWGISRVPILRIRSATPMIYAISMIPLLAVFVLGIGTPTTGSRPEIIPPFTST